MEYRVLRPEAYRQMLWKNGRGTTCEIGREPADDNVPFTWRLSIADIKENGPFSKFPEYMRVISTLEGAGMRLRVDGRWSGPLVEYDPFVFSGRAEVESELLGGPIRDFNLIFNPELCRGRLQWLDLTAERVFCAQASRIMIFTVARATVSGPEFTAELAAGGTLEIVNPGRDLGRFSVSASGEAEGGHCCLIELD